METIKIGICEGEDFSLAAIDKLKEIGEVSIFNGNDLKLFISDKNIIFVRLKYFIDDELIENACRLKYICSPTTGLNHIKITNPNVEIVSLKGEYDFLSSIRATPEHVFGLTISLLRNYAHAFLSENNSVFDRNKYKGYELYKNKIGIIGMGRVGKIISKYFRTFDADVYYYDPVDKNVEGACKCHTIEEVIINANVIILAANYTENNKKMISDSYFKIMKDKYFINAARGELVDEDSLLKYVKEGWFKGLAIDVISEETSNREFLNVLLKYTDKENIIITPHIAGATYTSMERTEEFITEKLITAILNKCDC